jgi:hypothetical protein
MRSKILKIKLPNFLVVGAAKSGTTSIYHYLKQHPEIYVPENKEPRFFVSSKFEEFHHNNSFYNYFCKGITFTLENYRILFDGVTKETSMGEASVQYLYLYNIAIPQIKQYLVDIKIIIILRNPVERAFSTYNHLFRDKLESLPFEKCLEIEEERIRANWFPLYFYKDMGFYHKQVKAYMENFSRVKVYLYDDLKKDSLGLVRNIYEFLGVDPSFIPYNISTKYNVSGLPKFKLLESFLLKYNHPLKKLLRPLFLNTIGIENTENLVNHLKNKNLRKTKIKPTTREYLIKLYRDDILMLEKLINRDLSAWLK